MRGTNESSGALFSYLDLDERVPEGLHRAPIGIQRDDMKDLLADVDPVGSGVWFWFGAHPAFLLVGCGAKCDAGMRGGPSHYS